LERNWGIKKINHIGIASEKVTANFAKSFV
jgi:hypothetical protein